MAGAARAVAEGQAFDRQLGRPGGRGIPGSYNATGRGGPQVTGQRAQPLSRGGGGAARGGAGRAPGGAGRAGQEGAAQTRAIREAAAQKNLAQKGALRQVGVREGEVAAKGQLQQREAPRARAAGFVPGQRAAERLNPLGGKREKEVQQDIREARRTAPRRMAEKGRYSQVPNPANYPQTV